MSVVLLTQRSVNNENVTAASKLFVVANMSSAQANPNTAASVSVTDESSSAQMSAWVLNFDRTVGNRLLYWGLTNSGTTRTVNIYEDSALTSVVATGSRTSDGSVTIEPVAGRGESSGISGSVTVAYSATDADSANILTCVAYPATSEIQLNGSTEFNYMEVDGNFVKYTVTETVSQINSAINGANEFLEAQVELTAAQIAVLNATPVEVVAAPGAGYILEPISAVIDLDYSGGALTTNVDADIINTTTGTQLMTAADGFSGTADKQTKFTQVAGVLNDNEALAVQMNTGEATVGSSTSTATVTVTYKITTL